MNIYDHNKIEDKWNDHWFKNNLFRALDFDSRPKKYILAEFPYPSGKALHAGHMMRFTVPDVYSHYLRMRGYNVLFPMGWDAFGLPAENFAINTGIHPNKSTREAIENYRISMRKMGYGIDWEREIATTDPHYYKWTQWIFLKFFKAGLAEYKEMPIWWCETLRTVLSDEEVLTDKNGNKISERGEHPVVRKPIKQWILKIPVYADKLLDGLNEVDFTEAIKSSQRNWINKKVGININYTVVDSDGNKVDEVICFTTRPETNFGATFVVISPEHHIANKIVKGEIKVDKNKAEEIKDYQSTSAKKSELERISEGRKKTGAFTGLYAVNNLNGTKMPIWVSDFVLSDFGTGAVVAVPGHDKRDFEFAQTFNLPIIRVVVGSDGDSSAITDIKQVQEDAGVMVNSDFLNGMDIHTATQKMMDFAEAQGWGKKITVYGIRDWVFSRQRYWGEPIPLIHKDNGTIEPIADPDNSEQVKNNLPLTLPEVPDYTPTPDGSSPLEKNKDWVNLTFPDGTRATRETNTMPNWAGSCWYYIRYIDPKNDGAFADYEKMKYWLPVDKYFGGAEHTTMHLLYSRFWHRFLYDQKLVPTSEPYAWRLNGGLLLGPDGKKMSKSKGNVVEPMETVKNYGADALRMFICFLGPYEDTYPWNERGIKATYRLIQNIYEINSRVLDNHADAPEIVNAYHKMLKNITEMLESLKMNTCISELMIFINLLKKQAHVSKEMWGNFLKVLAPFAPFISEELWHQTNNITTFENANSVHTQPWPEFNKEHAGTKSSKVPVQINGKLRGEIDYAEHDSEAAILDKLNANDKLKTYLENKQIKKLIVVPNKIINVVN